MGIYLVSVGAREWFDDGEEEGQGAVTAGLNEELRRRGLSPYESLPEEPERSIRGSGLSFEEKLVPSMDGFLGLIREHLGPSDAEAFLDWSVLVPVSLDTPVELSVESAYSETTVVAGAPQLLPLAQRLAEAVRLPLDLIPGTCDNLDLTMWFLDGPAKDTAAARPGPWGDDLDAAFYVAMYLRAAQHSIRRNCPLVYT
ncbi:hypothetical protein ABZ896_04150 [Streptomyces sp. NPDC047072]|uniref:hypothetical protein n=1 Tax=Streptomyces sp. NPDC047072 TaxID=3154809 RepID=UPI00340A0EEE